MFFEANINLGAESRSRTRVFNENEESTRFYSAKCESVSQLKFSRDGMVCAAHVINLAGRRSRLGNCTRLETGYSYRIAFPSIG
jgi:hypothetical protein